MARLGIALVCILIVLTGCVAWGQTLSAREQAADSRTGPSLAAASAVIEGKIVRIMPGDVPAIAVKPAEREPVIINMTRETSITKDGHPAVFGDLAVGDYAVCRVVKRYGALWAQAIKAQSPHIEVRGRIEKISYERGVIAIKTPDPDQLPVVFRVTNETRITKNGEPAQLGDLVVGDYASAKLIDTSDGLVALAVHARDLPPPFVVEGKIVGLDPERRIVAVQPPDTDQLPIAFQVTERTRLTRNGLPARFGDLRIGDFAHALLVDTNSGLVAIELHARAGHPPIAVIGTIVRIDAANRSVVMKPDDPAAARLVLFHVVPETRIERNGDPAQFEDLQIGDHGKAVLVETNRGLVALAIRVTDDPGIILRGTIVELNPEAGVVVLQPSDTTDRLVKIRVVERTKLFKDGRPADFGDLKIGDRVCTSVIPTDMGLVALWLSAHTPMYMVSGVVYDVNYQRLWFSVDVGAERRIMEFFVNRETMFVKDGRPASFVDILKGDGVMVGFLHLDEGNLALKVVARSQ